MVSHRSSLPVIGDLTSAQAKVSLSCTDQAWVTIFLSPATVLSCWVALLPPWGNGLQGETGNSGQPEFLRWLVLFLVFVWLECCCDSLDLPCSRMGWSSQVLLCTLSLTSSCSYRHWTCSDLQQVNKNNYWIRDWVCNLSKYTFHKFIA